MATNDTATTTKKPAAAKRKPATAAKRKPAAKQTTRTTARSTAASAAKPATRGAAAQQLAERAVLIPVGAALEARDRVAELVATTRSRSALERQLMRFEHRGDTARTEFEREVRRTRTRIEREAREARRGIERRRAVARRTLGSNVEVVTGRVENAVQNGVNAGIKLVNEAQSRLPKVA